MKLSTIIPVYNAEKFLRRCLDSVIGQALPNHEIICVDDGSEDGSLAIMQEYANKYANIIVISQENQHAGIARNTGIDAATGDYIHFMDSDDYLNEGVYKEIIDYLTKKPDIDYLKLRATAFSIGKEGQNSSSYYSLDYLSDDYFGRKVDLKNDAEILINKAYVAPWGGIYKKTLLDNIRFNNLPCHEDREFYLKVLIGAKHIEYFSEFVVNHQIDNSDSIMGKALDMFDAILRSYSIISKSVRGVDNNIRELILKNEFHILIYWFLSQKSEKLEVAITKMKDFLLSFDWSDIGGFAPKDMNKVLDLVIGEEIRYLSITDLVSKIKDYKVVYLYGAGYYGKVLVKVLRHSINAMLFIETKSRGDSDLCGIPIIGLDDLSDFSDCAVLISTKSIYHVGILDELNKRGISNIYGLKDEELNRLDIFCKTADILGIEL